jgi:hypothetical protein
MTEATMISELEATFGGEVVGPGEPAYDGLRHVFNAMVDRRPGVIARCTGAADVIAAVNFARQRALPIAVHGGGHGVSGHAVCDGGVMIDLRPMKAVRVDPERRVAHAQAGLTWGELDRETQAFGLAVTGGRMSTTGVAGFTLGSGSGWLERKLGLAADNLLSADVVLADGSAAITARQVAESRDETARRIDWAGAASFCVANALLVYALLRGNDEGWSSPLIVSLLAAALVMFAVFVVIERRVAQPMLPLRLFRTPAFTGAQLVAVAISGSVFAGFLYITLYLQEILRFSPLQAGLRYLPSTVTAFVVAGATAGLQRRVPPRFTLAAGLVLAAAGELTLSGVQPNDSWTVILPAAILLGVSLGLVNPVLANVALSSAPERISGVASGTNDTFRQVAVASGVAGLGAILIGLATQRITALVPGLSGHAAVSLADSAASGALPAALPAPLLDAARSGFTHGFDVVAVVGAVLNLAGALAALLLVRDRDLVHREAIANAPAIASASTDVAVLAVHRSGWASPAHVADRVGLEPMPGHAQPQLHLGGDD